MAHRKGCVQMGGGGWLCAKDCPHCPPSEMFGFRGDREVPDPKPVTLASIVQTNFGTLALDTHGQAYQVERGNQWVLRRISFTVQES